MFNADLSAKDMPDNPEGTDSRVETFKGEDPEGRDALLCVNNLGDWRARDENDLHYWSGSKDLQGCAPHCQQMV